MSISSNKSSIQTLSINILNCSYLIHCKLIHNMGLSFSVLEFALTSFSTRWPLRFHFSVIEPLLFLLCINHPADQLHDKMFKFANDMKLISTFSEFDSSMQNLSNRSAFSVNDQLPLHAHKCNQIALGHTRRHWNQNRIQTVCGHQTQFTILVRCMQIRHIRCVIRSRTTLAFLYTMNFKASRQNLCRWARHIAAKFSPYWDWFDLIPKSRPFCAKNIGFSCSNMSEKSS